MSMDDPDVQRVHVFVNSAGFFSCDESCQVCMVFLSVCRFRERHKSLVRENIFDGWHLCDDEDLVF